MAAPAAACGKADGADLEAAAAHDEPLPAAEAKLNLQEQVDEMMALASIYSSAFDAVAPAEEGGASSIFRLRIHSDLPGPVSVTPAGPPESVAWWQRLPLPSRDAAKAEEQPGPASSPLSLRHLPPLTLAVRLPASYPSRSPPAFTLACLWLGRRELSALCAALDAQVGAGQVVVFAWAEWLAREALGHLGIGDALELPGQSEAAGSCGGSDTPPAECDEALDERAVCESRSPDRDVAALLEYDRRRWEEEFRDNYQCCSICFEERPGVDFCLLPCRHAFCTECSRQYCATLVAEGAVQKLICPDPCCTASFPPHLVKGLLPRQDFARYEDLMLQRTLDAMEDLIYCPRCSSVCFEDPADNHGQCGKCFYSFCGLCRDRWHVGSQCVSAEARLRILQKRSMGRAVGEEQQRKEADLVNEIKNLKYVFDEAKQCPTCKMAIAKEEGCNKMVCTNCGGFFCYRCGKAIPGYEHFREGSCVLFEQEEIDRWNTLHGVPAREERERPEVVGHAFEQLVECPHCRQPSLKGNNNHVRCWACRNGFCAKCMRPVKSTAEHFGFGPNKCRQHS
eukprot:SM000203S06120  [mRNA]  locus=s203:26648:29899:+ [translate_table: standard]